MDLIKRYLIVPGVKFDNEVIPIWDERLEYDNDDYFGKRIYNKETQEHRSDTVEVLYDLKTRKISLGEEVDSYPPEKRLEFKKGESVFYEVKHSQLKESVVTDIVYEEYDTEILKGKKLTEYYVQDAPKDVDPEKLYVLKRWKPFYILEDGTKVTWPHKLYHKVK